MTETPYFMKIDNISLTEWNALLPSFTHATIYQTPEYGDVRWGARNLSRSVLYKNGVPVAAAQITIKKKPYFPLGVAFVSWGPLWQTINGKMDLDVCRQMIQGLKREYVDKRKLILVFDTANVDDGSSIIKDLFMEEGFIRTKRKCYSTILMDLSHDIDTIRKELNGKWRNQLNKANGNGLEVHERTDPEAFELFIQLSAQMINRKGFKPGVDYKQFKQIFASMSKDKRMRLLTCTKDGEPVAAVVYSLIGEMAVLLLAATGDKGLTYCGSYLLQWEIVCRLRAEGCKVYDLGGINPIANPGVYHFKSGLAGKNGTEVSHIGEYEYCPSRFQKWIFYCVDEIRSRMLKWNILLLRK